MASEMIFLPVGTQTVPRVDISATERLPALPKGSAGVILSAPSDNLHKHLVKFRMAVNMRYAGRK